MAITYSNPLGNNGGRSYSFLNKPVTISCSFNVQAADSGGLGITQLKGSGVQNVFMHTSTTAGTGNNGYVNPNPASGIAMIQLNNNYAKLTAMSSVIQSPVTGSALAINGSALTVGAVNQIVTVGTPTKGATTIAPAADSAGSLASTWFRLYDAYGNTFVIWFSVSGVGTAPTGISGTLVQQSIATNDTAATIGAALVVTIGLLPSGVSGVYSFTAAGTTTVTVTSTANGPLPGSAADGTTATGFTFALTKYKTNLQNWQNVGLPKGLTPAVGQSFVATATGDSTGGGSTGTTKLLTISGISKIELLGDPSLTLAGAPMGGSPNVGGWILVQFLAPTSSSVTTLIPTAPTTGSIVRMKFLVEASSSVISGE